VLHDQKGRVLVDDVLTNPLKTEEFAKGTSLKDQLSAIVPVYELAASIHRNQPKQTLRLVTDDFYNRVFSLTQAMPEAAYGYLNLVSSSQPEVTSPQRSLRSQKEPRNSKTTGSKNLVIEFNSHDDQKTYVTFTNQNSEMRVSLIEEDGLLRVNDASFSEPGSEVAQYLKQTMRMELAQNRSGNMIRTVSAQERTVPSRNEQTTYQQRLPHTPSPQKLPRGFAQKGNDVTGSPLKNALYEQYETARPHTQVEQTRFSSAPKNTTQKNKTPLTRPPRQHQFEDHPLLKPIPIP